MEGEQCYDDMSDTTRLENAGKKGRLMLNKNIKSISLISENVRCTEFALSHVPNKSCMPSKLPSHCLTNVSLSS